MRWRTWHDPPYDVSAWAEFANTVAGGAAALAGLMFVGLSLNLAEVLIAGISLWLQAGGGLYWVTAAVATGFASASANA